MFSRWHSPLILCWWNLIHAWLPYTYIEIWYLHIAHVYWLTASNNGYVTIVFVRKYLHVLNNCWYLHLGSMNVWQFRRKYYNENAPRIERAWHRGEFSTSLGIKQAAQDNGYFSTGQLLTKLPKFAGNNTITITKTANANEVFMIHTSLSLFYIYIYICIYMHINCAHTILHGFAFYCFSLRKSKIAKQEEL